MSAKKKLVEICHKVYAKGFVTAQKSFLKNEIPHATGEDGLINLKLMEELEQKCLQRKS